VLLIAHYRAGLTLWGPHTMRQRGARGSNATTALVTFVRHPFYFPQRLGPIIYASYTYFSRHFVVLSGMTKMTNVCLPLLIDVKCF